MSPTRRGPLAVVLVAALVARAEAGAPRPALPGEAIVLATDAKQPCAAVDANGNVHVAFLRAGDVAVATSRDRGATFSAPRVAIDVRGRARGGAQRGPRLGVDRAGRLTVTAPLTFDAAEAGRRYPTPEIYAATSGDGGATWSAPVRVNEAEKKAPEGLHAMRVAADGTVHVAWLDLRDRTHGQDLWYARIVGGKVGPNVRVARDVCECCAPGLALDGAGNPFLAWREGGEKPSREVYASRSTDGGATFGDPVRVNREDTKELSCPMSAPALAVSPDGTRFAAAWKDVREGTARVWWAFAGSPRFSGEAAIAEGDAVRNHPTLAALDAGTFWAAWEEERGGASLVRARASTTGSAVLDVAEVRDGVAGFPSVAAAAGIVVVAWEEKPKTGAGRVLLRVLGDAPR